MSRLAAFIINRPFLSVCIVVGIVFLIFWKGCLCNSNHSTNPDVKLYKDSVAKLNNNLYTVDKELMTQLKKFSGLVLFYSNKSDSLEQLRNEDLKLLAASTKRATPLIQFVRHDSLSTKECDSLADEFQNYIWANQRTNDLTDSLLASKDFQIDALDSSNAHLLSAYLTCKEYFKASTELFGLTYQAYQKTKPRNVVSVAAGAQYFTGTNIFGALAGFDFMNKKQQSLTVLGLVDNKGNKGGQALFKVPIRLGKK